MLNLDFLPDAFFDATNPNETPKLYKSYLKVLGDVDSLVGKYLGSTMNYDTVDGHGANFAFGGGPQVNFHFGKILNAFLQEFAGYIPPADRHITLLWVAGVLATMLQRPQDGHCDHRHNSLTQYDNKISKLPKYASAESDEPIPRYPWSLIMPLNTNGCRLAMYGPYEPENNLLPQKIPAHLVIPPKHVLLFR